MAASRNLLSLAALALATTLTATAQTAPSAVPVPFTTSLAGNGATATASTCTTGIAMTDGSVMGDGCVSTLSHLHDPQGASVDSLGNIYFADYNNKAVRVIYNGGTALAAAIKAANSGYAISATRTAPAPTPVVGNIYTIAGMGAGGATALAGNACANYASSGATGLNTLGDGCPAAAAFVGPRAVVPDSDGNLFITDYTDGRIRIFCVNCATGTKAAALIALEDAGVTPVNGAMYTIVGFTSGFRDAMIGFTSAANSATTAGSTAAPLAIALLRLPSAAALSANDDVYIADNTDNAVRLLYNGGTIAKNLLIANGIATPVQGYVYTLVGAGCVSADSMHTGSVSSANACKTIAGSDAVTVGTATPANVVWTVYLDANNNVYYSDSGNGRIKVMYGGVANPLTVTGTLTTGSVYSFAGQGTGVAGVVTNVAPSLIPLAASAPQGVGGDAFGNIFFIDYTNGLIYETYAATGLTSIIVGQYSNPTNTTGAYCNALTTGPQMTDASYNGCPGSQTHLGSARGTIVTDTLGNLYFGDATAYFLRKFTYNPTFPATTVKSTATSQSYAFALQSLTTAVTSESLYLNGVTTTEYTDAGNDVCTVLAGNTCVYNVSFTPKLPGARAGSIVLNGATGVLGTDTFVGIGNGSALAVDPGTITTTGTGYAPNGIALDGGGGVYFSDATSKNLIKYSGTAATTVATGFTLPAGVSVDNSGNIFVADKTANTITEIPVIGGTKYTVVSGLNGPQGLAADSLGRIYIADTGNNRVLILGTGATKTFAVAAFTGLSGPLAVAVDSAFNVYASDAAKIYKLTPAGVQTTIASSGGITGLAVDAAGNLVAGTTGSLTEYPVSGSASVLYGSLSSVKGIALDGSGNVFIADAGAGGFVEDQRTAGYYKFITTSGSTTIRLSSIGTSAVSSTAYTQSDSVDYTLVPATTNGCSGALASGTTCALTASFATTTPGILTDNVVFTAPVTNGSPTLTLINVSLIPAVTVTASPTTLSVGSTETLTATAYGPSNTSGSVAFFNNGSTTAFATVAVDNTATAKYAYTPPAGSYSITATFTPTTGSPVSTTAAATFTVTQATPTVSVTLSPTSGYTTTPITITATVTSTVGTPTQTVTFFVNGTQLGNVQTLASGVASYTGTLPQGNDCVTAKYSGDTNFVPVTTTCQNITIAAGFSVTASTTALAFQPNYQEAQAFLNFNPGGRTDTLTFACSGLPAKVSCAFSPAMLTLNGGSTTQTVQMLVSNSGATSSALHEGPAAGFFGAKTVAVAALPLAALLLFGLRRRKLPIMLALLLLSLGAAVSLTGCSGQDPTSKYQASGSYPFTVTISSGSTTLQTLNFTLTIP